VKTPGVPEGATPQHRPCPKPPTGRCGHFDFRSRFWTVPARRVVIDLGNVRKGSILDIISKLHPVLASSELDAVLDLYADQSTYGNRVRRRALPPAELAVRTWAELPARADSLM